MFQVSSDVVARRRSSRAAALEFSAKLDGVESESSVRSAASEVRFGHLVQIDERLKAMRLRDQPECERSARPVMNVPRPHPLAELLIPPTSLSY